MLQCQTNGVCTLSEDILLRLGLYQVEIKYQPFPLKS